jgi:hypothetical protein
MILNGRIYAPVIILSVKELEFEYVAAHVSQYAA